MKINPNSADPTTLSFEQAVTDKSSAYYALRLFVTGMSPRSQSAIANTRSLCETYLKGRYGLEVIDIYQYPRAASENQVLGAPTLIKQLPLPLRRFVGDMAKTEKLLAGLDIPRDPKPD